VVHNFTATAARKLGADWDRVREVNPKVIHLTISGFGPDEPDRRGYDLIAQALGGLMAVTGERGGGPVKVGVPIADLTAGLYASTAITAALMERIRTGTGRAVEVSLYESVLSLLSNQAAGWLLAGAEGERLGTDHPSVAPYGVYAARDGSIVIAAATDGQFGQLCAAIGRPDLPGDARFASNGDRVLHREELRKELEQALAARTPPEWAAALDERGIPNGAVRSVSEALTAPEARSVRTVTHPRLGPVGQVMSPIRVGGDILGPYLAPPAHGEHDGLIFPQNVEQAP
jgi:crotonobetainyl-CoA:carnitine CoA-transferase CaiB-like acyl-CoA transferase